MVNLYPLFNVELTMLDLRTLKLFLLGRIRFSYALCLVVRCLMWLGRLDNFLIYYLLSWFDGRKHLCLLEEVLGYVCTEFRCMPGMRAFSSLVFFNVGVIYVQATALCQDRDLILQGCLFPLPRLK
jgi:hypothetical protein